MESRKVGGLYLVGEMLDLTGPSGGYNLQLSWSTGWVAGEFGGKRAQNNAVGERGAEAPPIRRTGDGPVKSEAGSRPRGLFRSARRLALSPALSVFLSLLCAVGVVHLLAVSPPCAACGFETAFNIPLAKSRPCWSGR